MTAQKSSLYNLPLALSVALSEIRIETKFFFAAEFKRLILTSSAPYEITKTFIGKYENTKPIVAGFSFSFYFTSILIITCGVHRCKMSLHGQYSNYRE